MTLRSPALPKDPLEPFRSTEDWAAASLERDVAVGGERRRQGFLKTARLLLQAAVDAAHWSERDALIWPALYCFRHYVELQLKQLARAGLALGLAQPTNTHKLRPSWLPVRAGIARTLGESDEPIATVDQAIAVFDALDPSGDGLRYATRRDGTPSMAVGVYIEPASLLRLIEATADVLNAAETAFDVYVETLREIWS